MQAGSDLWQHVIQQWASPWVWKSGDGKSGATIPNPGSSAGQEGVVPGPWDSIPVHRVQDGAVSGTQHAVAAVGGGAEPTAPKPSRMRWQRIPRAKSKLMAGMPQSPQHPIPVRGAERGCWAPGPIWSVNALHHSSGPWSQEACLGLHRASLILTDLQGRAGAEDPVLLPALRSKRVGQAYGRLEATSVCHGTIAGPSRSQGLGLGIYRLLWVDLGF